MSDPTPILNLDQYHALVRKPKRQKYGNKCTTVNGHHFASRAEAERYKVLLLLETARVISHLKLQPRFRLEVNGVHLCDYVGDFEYYELGARIIEDVKGYRTRDFRIKQRLMLAIHGIELRLT